MLEKRGVPVKNDRVFSELGRLGPRRDRPRTGRPGGPRAVDLRRSVRCRTLPGRQVSQRRPAVARCAQLQRRDGPRPAASVAPGACAPRRRVTSTQLLAARPERFEPARAASAGRPAAERRRGDRPSDVRARRSAHLDRIGLGHPGTRDASDRGPGRRRRSAAAGPRCGSPAVPRERRGPRTPRRSSRMVGRPSRIGERRDDSRAACSA